MPQSESVRDPARDAAGEIPGSRRLAARRIAFAGGGVDQSRLVPDEVPVALVHDGTTHAVMLATPADLEDFAIGFALSEGIAPAAADLGAPEVVTHPNGIEVRLWLGPEAGSRHRARRRAITGPTGCGLCGVDSLEAAVPPPRRITAEVVLHPADIEAAVRAVTRAQPLGTATRAVHAAAAWSRDRGLVMLREDVGRHNALDKLIGALARAGEAAPEIVVITSRISVEMVQKTAVLGAPVLVAVSAPTALAAATAEAAGLTLAAVARDDGFELFTHPHRIALPGSSRDVA